MSDMIEESPPKRPRARQNIVTPSLATALDWTQVSNRKVAIVLTETARSLVMICLLWLSTEIPFLVHIKPQELNLSKTFEMNFMQKKHLQFTKIWEVKAVKHFCFHFQLHIKLVASEFASASSLFLQSASASRRMVSFWKTWRPKSMLIVFRSLSLGWVLIGFWESPN